jgi:hypothetical protein
MSESTPQPLRCTRAYWAEGAVKDLLQKPPEELTQEEAILVMRELDRRFLQLWDKVTFEREHKLIDYSPIMKTQR